MRWDHIVPRDAWPPIICNACGGKLAKVESDMLGYVMCTCEKCQHRIYRHIKGDIISEYE